VRLIVEADGGSRGNPGVAGFGALVRDAASGRVLAERAAYLGDHVTNNVAEYSGLIAGLRAALAIDPEAKLEVRMDSRLVVSQMSGAWRVKSPELAKLAAEARALIGARRVTFTWLPRARNQAADSLANRAMDARSTIEKDLPTAPRSAPAGRRAGDRAASDTSVGDAVPPGGAPAGRRAGDRAASDTSVGDAVPPGGAPAGRRAGDRTASDTSVGDAVWLAQAARSGAQAHPGTAGPITTVALVRHGMSVDTERDIFSGTAVPGPPLSAAGRLQAEAAGTELGRMFDVPWFGLAHPTALLASPTRRTWQTAEALARSLGLTVEADEAFIEEGFGQWDGLTKAEVDERWPGGVDRWATDAAYVPPGGESREQVGRRVKAGLTRVAQAHIGGTVVIASHAMATRAAIGVALGAPPDAWFSFRVAPGSINVLRLWDLGKTEVVCTNRTAAR
jgi:probable phosphoglycerate mutase